MSDLERVLLKYPNEPILTIKPTKSICAIALWEKATLKNNAAKQSAKNRKIIAKPSVH